jgi:hypothetical protein
MQFTFKGEAVLIAVFLVLSEVLALVVVVVAVQSTFPQKVGPVSGRKTAIPETWVERHYAQCP